MKQFIGETIQVELKKGTFLEKKPQCPLRIHWDEKWIDVVELISSWEDFSRRGDASRNMRKEHLDRARVRGSWGVGRFYFQFLGSDRGSYTIYYDRAPSKANDRKGSWVLFSLERE